MASGGRSSVPREMPCQSDAVSEPEYAAAGVDADAAACACALVAWRETCHAVIDVVSCRVALCSEHALARLWRADQYAAVYASFAVRDVRWASRRAIHVIAARSKDAGRAPGRSRSRCDAISKNNCRRLANRRVVDGYPRCEA